MERRRPSSHSRLAAALLSEHDSQLRVLVPRQGADGTVEFDLRTHPLPKAALKRRALSLIEAPSSRPN